MAAIAVGVAAAGWARHGRAGVDAVWTQVLAVVVDVCLSVWALVLVVKPCAST